MSEREVLIIYTVCFVAVVMLLFKALYLRDVLRKRHREGKQRLPGCMGVMLRAGVFFGIAVGLILTRYYLETWWRRSRWWWSWSYIGGGYFTQFLLAIGALICIGLGVAMLLRWNNFFRGPREDEQTAILGELALCMERGLPVEGLLDSIGKESRSSITYYATAAAARLREGSTLSSALGVRSLLPPHAVASIQAGERAGGRTLPLVLHRLADDFRQERETRSPVKVGLAYCGLLTLFVWPIMQFQGTFIVPKFEQILRVKPLTQATPSWWPAYLNVMDYGVFAMMGLLLVLIVGLEGVQRPVLGTRVTKFARKMRAARRKWCDCIPFLRSRMRHECLARAASVMSALVAAKVSLEEAAQAAADPDISGPYSMKFKALGWALHDGMPLVKAVERSKLPQAFGVFLRAGENGAEMDRSLRLAAEYQQVKRARADRTLALAVPLFLLPLIGALVASSYIGTLGVLNAITRGMTP